MNTVCVSFDSAISKTIPFAHSFQTDRAIVNFLITVCPHWHMCQSVYAVRRWNSMNKTTHGTKQIFEKKKKKKKQSGINWKATTTLVCSSVIVIESYLVFIISKARSMCIYFMCLFLLINDMILYDSPHFHKVKTALEFQEKKMPFEMGSKWRNKTTNLFVHNWKMTIEWHFNFICLLQIIFLYNFLSVMTFNNASAFTRFHKILSTREHQTDMIFRVKNAARKYINNPRKKKTESKTNVKWKKKLTHNQPTNQTLEWKR